MSLNWCLLTVFQISLKQVLQHREKRMSERRLRLPEGLKGPALDTQGASGVSFSVRGWELHLILSWLGWHDHGDISHLRVEVLCQWTAFTWMTQLLSWADGNGSNSAWRAMAWTRAVRFRALDNVLGYTLKFPWAYSMSPQDSDHMWGYW